MPAQLIPNPMPGDNMMIRPRASHPVTQSLSHSDRSSLRPASIEPATGPHCRTQFQSVAKHCIAKNLRLSQSTMVYEIQLPKSLVVVFVALSSSLWFTTALLLSGAVYGENEAGRLSLKDLMSEATGIN